MSLRSIYCTAALIPFVSVAQLALADPSASSNKLEIIGFEVNPLTTTQSEDGGHSLTIALIGPGGGIADVIDHDIASWFGTLEPGTITQVGTAQRALVSISGQGNMFSIAQSGGFNVVRGDISGTSNFSAIQQSGNANRAAFSQAGQGNRLSVYQSM